MSKKATIKIFFISEDSCADCKDQKFEFQGLNEEIRNWTKELSGKSRGIDIEVSYQQITSVQRIAIELMSENDIFTVPTTVITESIDEGITVTMTVWDRFVRKGEIKEWLESEVKSL